MCKNSDELKNYRKAFFFFFFFKKRRGVFRSLNVTRAALPRFSDSRASKVNCATGRVFYPSPILTLLPPDIDVRLLRLALNVSNISCISPSRRSRSTRLQQNSGAIMTRRGLVWTVGKFSAGEFDSPPPRLFDCDEWKSLATATKNHRNRLCANLP